MSAVPHKIKDLLDLSSTAKKEYSSATFKVKIIDFFLCFFGLLTIILAFLDNYQIVETYNVLSGSYVVSSYNNILRFFNLSFNIILCVLIVIRYFFILKIHKIRSGPIANYDTLYSLGLLPYLILEIGINMLFIPPFVEQSYSIDGSIYVDYDYTSIFNPNNFTPKTDLDSLKHKSTSIQLLYNVASIIAFFMMIRIYHVFRLFFTFSYWETPRAQTICTWMNTKATTGFTIKAYLKIIPYICLIIGVVFVMVVCGLATQLFEYYNGVLMKSMGHGPLSTNSGIVNTMLSFNNVYSSFWLMLVTMTTVGYGDIYPTTYFGRVIAIAGCVAGTFILSLLVVFLNQTISFDDVERNVYNEIMEHKENPTHLKREAANFVGKFLKYCYLAKMYPDKTAGERLFLFTEMKYLAKQLKMHRITSIKIDNDIDGILNNIGSHLTNQIDPLKKAFEEFNKEKFYARASKNKEDDTFKNLKKSNQLSTNLLKNSVQIWNLLKVMNKKKYLSNLNSINDVYDSQADFVEEIEYFHNNKEKFEEIKRVQEEPVSNSRNDNISTSLKEEEKPLPNGEIINSIQIPD